MGPNTLNRGPRGIFEWVELEPTNIDKQCATLSVQADQRALRRRATRPNVAEAPRKKDLPPLQNFIHKPFDFALDLVLYESFDHAVTVPSSWSCTARRPFITTGHIRLDLSLRVNRAVPRIPVNIAASLDMLLVTISSASMLLLCLICS